MFDARSHRARWRETDSSIVVDIFAPFHIFCCMAFFFLPLILLIVSYLFVFICQVFPLSNTSIDFHTHKHLCNHLIVLVQTNVAHNLMTTYSADMEIARVSNTCRYKWNAESKNFVRSMANQLWKRRKILALLFVSFRWSPCLGNGHCLHAFPHTSGKLLWSLVRTIVIP